MNNIDSNKVIDDILASQEGDLLKYLTVKEVCILQRTSSCFRKWSKIEIDRRYQNWLETCSRAWEVWSTLGRRLELYRIFDDLPLDDAVKSHLEDIAKNMSGGIEVFLHNREVGAPSQPNLFAYGKDIRYTTLGDEYKEIPIVAMFDLYCDGRQMWNGVCEPNIGSISFREDDNEDDEIEATRTHLISNNTLGDETDEATYHPVCYFIRPRRYLLSTNAEDTRTWTINLSFLTKKSAETLVVSWEFQPKELVSNTFAHQWDNQERQLSKSEGCCKGVLLNKKVKRCSWWEIGANCKLLCKENEIIECNKEYNHFEICFWLDERDPGDKRFHINVDFICENSFLGGMILNGR